MPNRLWRGLLHTLLILLTIGLTRSDLPIHCIKAQVVGDWQLYLSPTKKVKSFQDASCGYSLPSTVEDAQLNKPGLRFPTSRLLGLKLDPFNQVYSAGRKVGTWSMVYDEGLSLEIEQGSYFVFFEYDMKQGISVSTCSRTLVGWYRDTNSMFGCFYAHQMSATNRITPVSVGSEIIGLKTVPISEQKLLSLAKMSSSLSADEDMFLAIMQSKKAQSAPAYSPVFKSLAETNSEADSENEATSEETASTDSSSDNSTPPATKPQQNPAIKKTAVKPVRRKQKVQSNRRQRKTSKAGKVVQLKPVVVKALPLPPKSTSIGKKKAVGVRQAKKFTVKKTIKRKITIKKQTKKVKGKKVVKKVRGKSKVAPKRMVSRIGKLVGNKRSAKAGPIVTKGVKKVVVPTKPRLRKGEVLPWEDSKLKVNEPEYHVRRFWMDMNMHWITKKGSDKSLAQVSSTVVSESNRAEELVKSINDSNLGWKATKYAFLAEKTATEVNKFVGRPKQSNKFSLSERSDSKWHPELQTNVILAEVDMKNMPVELDLSEFLSKPRTQNNCGNCYLIATIGMLESRLRMKANRDMPLSIQYLNDCNFYSQGCEGGFALEALRFVRDFWAPPERCKPFLSTQGTCSPGCLFGTPTEVVTVDKSYYVGEFFGKTTEQLLMQELMENGPLVVNIEPPETFAYYKSGIYRPTSSPLSQSYMGERQWTKVDHSVLLYGWGEENNTKFWRVQNSWGREWGEHGTFRILRGTNALGIEAMGEAGIPRIITVSI